MTEVENPSLLGLNLFVYAINKEAVERLSQSLSKDIAYRAIGKMFEMFKIEIEQSKNSLEVITKGIGLLEGLKFLEENQVFGKGNDNTLEFDVKASCPFRIACSLLKEEGNPRYCTTALYFRYILEKGTGHRYFIHVKKCEPAEKCELVLFRK